MSEPEPTDPLASVRARRDVLYEAMLGLERAMSVPARGRVEAWSAVVGERLGELAAAWRAHLGGTEGDDGLFAEILDREPRLAHAVERLRADHQALSDALAAAEVRLADARDADEVDETRAVLLELMHGLFEHRSRGAELVYEAYDVDLSAGD
ncbi:MAG TPA: hypothetical protein VF152_05915 [Acidimicrobiia bacterium]